MAVQVDLQYFAQEKTEKATPKKRQDVRKKGQVAKSTEVNTALILFFTFLLLLFFGSRIMSQIVLLFKSSLQQQLNTALLVDNIPALFHHMAWQALIILLPVIGACLLAALIGNYIQVGFLFSWETVQMKLNRIDPIQGAKRIFSLRALVELFKAILKFTLIALVAGIVLYRSRHDILLLSRWSLNESAAFIGGMILKMGLSVSVVLIVLALFDYIYQRFDYEKNIRMSKQEVKDEYKKTEGDPLIKGKIKEKQRAMAMRRMMQDIPKADVVITNPTHYAVALGYDKEKNSAPVVLAKGVDQIALNIRRVAAHHHVAIMENKPLAQTLYRTVEIGQEVPPELYQAVAEVLAYVYRLRNG